MKDDGVRLSCSISASKISINSNLDGRNFIKLKYNSPISATLDTNTIYQHFNAIQTLILQNKKRVRPFLTVPNEFPVDDAVRIIEGDHYVYRIFYGGKAALLTETSFKVQLGFDVQAVLKLLNWAYSEILQCRSALDIKQSIIRRFADVGILVWVYDGHTVICRDSNISGCVMLNCLVDDVYHVGCYVSINDQIERCVIFDINTLDLLLELPIDASILTYFSYDKDQLK